MENNIDNDGEFVFRYVIPESGVPVGKWEVFVPSVRRISLCILYTWVLILIISNGPMCLSMVSFSLDIYKELKPANKYKCIDVMYSIS